MARRVSRSPGKHVDAKCDACHVDKRYKDTPRSCIGCHRKEDDDKGHKGQYGEKCETCHGTKAWKPSQFNHDTDTRYLLKEKHRQVKCASCHTTPLYAKKTGKECIDCHQKDDKHKDTLGRDCAKCHTERSWKEPAGFDHQKTKFPLRGRHVDTPCKECHADKRGTSRAHPRAASTATRRTTSTAAPWATSARAATASRTGRRCPAASIHDKTKFPLRNAHATKTVKCSDCHESARHFKNTPLACFSCHKRDDRHEGTLGEKCEQCPRRCETGACRATTTARHATRWRAAISWWPAAPATRACATARRHATATAATARTTGTRRPSAWPARPATNVRAWTLWDFDHDRGTRFRLEGKHRRITCEACHAKPAPPGSKSAPVGSDCMACHRKDDVHEGSFGRRCEQCHDSETWKRLKRGATR